MFDEGVAVDRVPGVPESSLVPVGQQGLEVSDDDAAEVLVRARDELSVRIAAEVQRRTVDGSIVSALFRFLDDKQIDALKASDQAVKLVELLRRISGAEDDAGGLRIGVMQVMASSPGEVTDSE